MILMMMILCYKTHILFIRTQHVPHIDVDAADDDDPARENVGRMNVTDLENIFFLSNFFCAALNFSIVCHQSIRISTCKWQTNDDKAWPPSELYIYISYTM